MTASLHRRSFASKYLHFHNPRAFFIYDSRAAKAITDKLGKGRHFKLPEGTDFHDRIYARFVLQCIEYRDDSAQLKPLTPRELDRALLGY